jgi:hypothetical protein
MILHCRQGSRQRLHVLTLPMEAAVAFRTAGLGSKLSVSSDSMVGAEAILRTGQYSETADGLAIPVGINSGVCPPFCRFLATFQTAGLGSKIAVSAANLARANIILHAETKMMEQAKVIEALREENEILRAERLTWTVKESEDESSEDEDIIGNEWSKNRDPWAAYNRPPTKRQRVALMTTERTGPRHEDKIKL